MEVSSLGRPREVCSTRLSRSYRLYWGECSSEQLSDPQFTMQTFLLSLFSSQISPLLSSASLLSQSLGLLVQLFKPISLWCLTWLAIRGERGSGKGSVHSHEAAGAVGVHLRATLPHADGDPEPLLLPQHGPCPARSLATPFL